jgi:hypothetical protein
MGDWDLDFFDCYDEYGDDSGSSEGITCQFCGEIGLEWERVSGPFSKKGQRFRLLEPDGTVHQCKSADADEFEVVNE